VFGGCVAVYDEKTLEQLHLLPVGGEGALAASPDGKQVYFASNEKPQFCIIDTSSHAVRTVGYPSGGHGIGSVAVSPDGRRLFLGIQRDRAPLEAGMPAGGFSFLAAYDLKAKEYVGTLYLAQLGEGGKSDDAIPGQMAFGPDGRLYVGMFQSRVGIHVIDAAALRAVGNIAFERTEGNKHFEWVDPTQLGFYGKWLLCVNRNNGELAVVEYGTRKAVGLAKLGAAMTDVYGFVVDGDRAYIGTAKNLVYVADLRELGRMVR